MARYARKFNETLPKTQPGSATLDARKVIYMLLHRRQSLERADRPEPGFNVRTPQRGGSGNGVIRCSSIGR